MNFSKHSLFVSAAVIASSVYFGLDAQPINIHTGDVVMPTPDAIGIARGVDAPVNLATGSANVSVPLYTVSIGDLSHPISLSYNTTGVKVAEPASWVGLGWSLNAGGMITRSVQGFEDEEGGGFNFHGSEINAELNDGDLDEVGDYEILQKIREGIWDAEPDIFAFSVNGMSGKFVILDGEVILLQKQNVEITFSIDNWNELESFHMVDGQGIQYWFGKVDSRLAYEDSRTYFHQSNVPTEQMRTGWKLLKMQGPSTRQINFYYDEIHAYSYKYPASIWFSADETPPNQIEIVEGYRTNGFHIQSTNYYYMVNDVRSHMLSRIETDYETVTFVEGSDRSDLDDPYWGSTKHAKCLDKIEVTIGSSLLIYDFEYDSYVASIGIGDPAVDTRLKLTQVQLAGLPPWTMEYNEVNLPHRLSKAIDHWGYYNGRNDNNNRRINIPGEYIPGDGTNPMDIRDSDGEYMKAGALEGIGYPSGLSHSFVFEANEYYASDEMLYDEMLSAFGTTACSTATSSSINVLFDEGYEAQNLYFDLDYILLYDLCEVDPDPVTFTIDAKVTENGVSIGDQSVVLDPTQDPISGEFTIQVADLEDSGIFVEGVEYTFTLTISGAGAAFCYLHHSYLAEAGNTQVGGLRIKSLTTNTGSSSLKKDYYYTMDASEEGTSSGILVSMPRYFYNAQGFRWIESLEQWNPIQEVFKRDQSIVPLSDFFGSHITYKHVAEAYEGNGSREVTHYIEEGEHGLTSFRNYPITPIQNKPEHGRQDFSYVKDINGDPDGSTSTVSYQAPRESVMTINKIHFMHPDIANSAIYHTTYNIYADYYQATQRIEEELGLSATIQMAYDDQSGALELPILKSVLTTAGGVSQTTTYSYAHDEGNSAMINAHMVEVPISTLTTGIASSGSKTDYASFSGCSPCIVPSGSSSWNWQSGWDPVYTIAEYNSDALPTKIIPRGYSESEAINYVWTDGLVQSKTFIDRTTSFQYHPSRLVSKITAPDGIETQFTYDGLRRLSTQFIGDKYTYTYNYQVGGGSNTVTTQKSFLETATSYDIDDVVSYDGLGRKTSSVIDGHLSESTAYDGMGRVVATKNPDATYITEYTYEASPIEQLESSWVNGWPRGRTHDQSVANGLILKETTDENDRSFLEYYNYFGQLVKEVRAAPPGFSASSSVTEYLYDGGGNMSQITAHAGSDDAELYTFSYDGRNQLLDKDIPIKGTYSYTYTPRQEMETMAIPGGTLYDYAYNDYGELLQVNMGGAPSIANTIGEDGIEVGRVIAKNVRLLDDSGEIDYDFTYDNFGRLKTEEVTHQWGMESVRYEYDDADVMTEMQFAHTGTGPIAYTDFYTPDKYMRIAIVDQQVEEEPARVYSASYNAIDQLTGVTHGDDLNGVSYEYNIRDWLKKINHVQQLDCIEPTEPQGPIDDGNIFVSLDIALAYDRDALFAYLPTVIQINITGEWIYENEVIRYWTYVREIYVNGPETGDPRNFPDNVSTEVNGYNPDPEIITDILIALILQQYPELYDVLLLPKYGNPGVFTIRGQINNEITDEIEDPPCQDNDHLFAEYIEYIKGDVEIGAEDQYTGNISRIDWLIYPIPEVNTYSYRYDVFDRLLQARFHEYEGSQVEDPYGVNIEYDDLMGNFKHITRRGQVGVGFQGEPMIGDMDDLRYQNSDNKLNSIQEYENQQYGYKGAGSSFTYDNYGKLTAAPGRGITNISYNNLELPESISTDEGYMTILYDAEGTKWQQITAFNDPPEGTPDTEDKLYIRNCEIVNGQISAVFNDHGRLIFDEGTGPRYEYAIRDHLGSTRVMITDKNEDGEINLDPQLEEVIQTENYYPFGMSMEGFEPIDITQPRHPFFYNGKEEVLKGLLDYGARLYDPQVGRWLSTDLAADEAPSWSPYRYGFDNPVRFIDPDGLFEDEASAREYAEENDIKIRPKSFIGKLFTSGRRSQIVEESDGSYAIINNADNTSISDYGEELGVLKGALVKANDIMSANEDGSVNFRDGSQGDNPVVVYTGSPPIGPGKVFKYIRALEKTGKVIKQKQAIERLKSGKDIWAEKASTAKKLMKKASGGGKVIKDKAHKKGFRDHFHDLKRRLKSHAFFGGPK